MWYIKHKETGLFLGSCHTTGDGIWVKFGHPSIESWTSKEYAEKDGLNYHPFHRLKESKVEIIEL